MIFYTANCLREWERLAQDCFDIFFFSTNNINKIIVFFFFLSFSLDFICNIKAHIDISCRTNFLLIFRLIINFIMFDIPMCFYSLALIVMVFPFGSSKRSIVRMSMIYVMAVDMIDSSRNVMNRPAQMAGLVKPTQSYESLNFSRLPTLLVKFNWICRFWK